MKILHKKSFSDKYNYTVQYMLELDDGNKIYAGYWEKAGYEKIISVTTQIGCKTQCGLFCNVEKYIRDITRDELLFQIETIITEENINYRDVKVSMVKEGEPFDNKHILELVQAIDFLGIPYLKISTSVPRDCEDKIRHVFELAKDLSVEIQLQVSLSSTNDKFRNMHVARPLLSLKDVNSLCIYIYQSVLKKNKKYRFVTLSFTIYEECEFDYNRIINIFDNKICCIRIRDASNSDTRGRGYTRITEKTFKMYEQIIKKSGFVFIDGRSEKLAVDNDLTIGLYKLREVLI